MKNRLARDNSESACSMYKLRLEISLFVTHRLSTEISFVSLISSEEAPIIIRKPPVSTTRVIFRSIMDKFFGQSEKDFLLLSSLQKETLKTF